MIPPSRFRPWSVDAQTRGVAEPGNEHVQRAAKCLDKENLLSSATAPGAQCRGQIDRCHSLITVTVTFSPELLCSVIFVLPVQSGSPGWRMELRL
jgi:hypothetical protein